MLASTLHAIATGNCLPGRGRDVLRRHQPGGRHQAGRPGQPPGPRHRHRRRPVRPPARRRTSCGARADGGRADLGAALPDVPAAALRRALRDQPVDARARSPVDHDRALDAVGAAWSATCGPPAPRSSTMEPQPDVPDLVFTANAGHRQRRPVRAQPLPPPRAPGRDRRSTPPGSPSAGLRGRPAARPSSTTRAPATRCRSRPRAARPCCCRATRSAATPRAATELGRRCSACPVAAGRSSSTRGCTTSTSRSARSTTAGPSCAPLGWDALRPQGDRGAGARAAVARGRRGAVVLRQLGGRRHARSSCRATPPRVGRQLEAWGFDVVECPVDEFLKAGGGCRCLTLALDVRCSARRAAGGGAA